VIEKERELASRSQNASNLADRNVDIINVFKSLLALLGIMGGEKD
jgi:hypothetical protein